MRTYHLSILFGLSTTVAVCAPLPIQAAQLNFNASSLNFDAFPFEEFPIISLPPQDSNYSLSLVGSLKDNQGYSGFSNVAPDAPDNGHLDISLNASGDGAPHYATGLQASFGANGATRTASVSQIANFPALSSYLTANEIPLSDIGFAFGQKNNVTPTKTWSLQDDINGKNYLAKPDLNIEGRVYEANPEDVEMYLTYGTNKIVTFGYSPINFLLNYGSTPTPSDDRDLGYTNPMTVTKVQGLDPMSDALATSFLEDVAAGGGAVQLVIDDDQPDEVKYNIIDGYNEVSLRFVGSLQAVPDVAVAVPEPCSTLGLLTFGTLGAVYRLKKQKHKRIREKLR